MTTAQLIIVCVTAWLCALTFAGAWSRVKIERERAKLAGGKPRPSDAIRALPTHVLEPLTDAQVRNLLHDMLKHEVNSHESWCGKTYGDPCNCGKGGK